MTKGKGFMCCARSDWSNKPAEEINGAAIDGGSFARADAVFLASGQEVRHHGNKKGADRETEKWTEATGLLSWQDTIRELRLAMEKLLVGQIPGVLHSKGDYLDEGL